MINFRWLRKGGVQSFYSVVAPLLQQASDPRQLDLAGPTTRFAGCGRPDGAGEKWSQAVRLHGEGCAGRGVAETTDGRQDAGSVGGGSRNEHGERAQVAARGVPVAAAQATYLAN